MGSNIADKFEYRNTHVTFYSKLNLTLLEGSKKKDIHHLLLHNVEYNMYGYYIKMEQNTCYNF
jgi:hypothetical protein